MSRLTKLDNDITKVKGTYMPYNERPIITLSNAAYVQCLLNKLGQLEDLEEELGCPLEVLIKALIEGVYYEDTDNYMIFLPVFLDFNLDDNYILYYVDEKLLTKDYKKTWWLKKDKSE